MIDFSCPRCGAIYHADEGHVGKQIRCTRPACHELISVDRRDGHYNYSDQQPQKEAKQQSTVASGNQEYRHSSARRHRIGKRHLIFASIACLLFVGAAAGYYFRLRQEARRSSGSAAVDLSSGLVETTGSVGVGGGQDSQPSSVAKTNADNPFYPPQSPSSPFYSGSPAPTEIPSRPTKSAKRETHEAPPRSLPTGTRIIPDQATSGDGQLEAVNGTGQDAHVMIVDTTSQTRVRDVSVQANSSFLFEHLDPGSYSVVFATGEDWDQLAEHFNRDASYFEVGTILLFRQDETSYERHTITLNTVPHGNVQRRRISEAEFHALSGKQ